MRVISIVSRKGKLDKFWKRILKKVNKVSPLIIIDSDEEFIPILSSFLAKYNIDLSDLHDQEIEEKVDLIVASKAFEQESVEKTIEVLDSLQVTDAFMDLAGKLLHESIFPGSVTNYLKELINAYSKK